MVSPGVAGHRGDSPHRSARGLGPGAHLAQRHGESGRRSPGEAPARRPMGGPRGVGHGMGHRSSRGVAVWDRDIEIDGHM